MRSAYVGVSIDAKLGLPVFMFTDYKVYTGPPDARNNNIFPALAVDQFGFLYSVWSDNSNIFFTSSSDHGKTWTLAQTINQGATVGKANVFPWVAADANGHVVVVWLGANLAGNSNDRSIMAHQECPIRMCASWIRAVVALGTTTAGSQTARRRPPSPGSTNPSWKLKTPSFEPIVDATTVFRSRATPKRRRVHAATASRKGSEPT